MPRFYFHVTHGETSKAFHEGIELASEDGAWIEAATACGETNWDLKGKLEPGGAWSMTVREDTGAAIQLLEFKTRALRKGEAAPG